MAQLVQQSICNRPWRNPFLVQVGVRAPYIFKKIKIKNGLWDCLVWSPDCHSGYFQVGAEPT